MDPITTAIVIALGKDACKDGYVALKDAMKKKFGDKSDLVDAVDKLEKKPDSEARKATLQEEVEISKVNDDPDIRKLVQDLLDQIKEQPGGQAMINQTQTNTVSGVNVGGNFEFKPVQDGSKS
jgi:aldehyde:ferredoxin oxidoreductase